MVLMKMLMEIALSDERSIGDDDGDDFLLREGSSPSGIALREGKSARSQVSSRDTGASSQKFHTHTQDHGDA